MLVCPECHESYPEGTAQCSKDGSALLPAEVLADADVALAPGTMVGEYRVDARLGSGTFGDVYAGEQPLIGKRVAIKVLRRKFSSEPQVVSRFISEARAVNRIRHRNIIDIFSFGLLPDRRHYFVMELVEGHTLGELLDKKGRLPIATALPILRGIADALDAAHEAGVTHRDLKPDNIFLAVEKDGRYFPKLLDFGVAKLVSDDVAHKTATGAAIGTPRYMAPEQARGKKVDHRADIYALGVVIHEMLTGQPPFEGDTAMDVLLKHTVEPPPPMSSVCRDLPTELDAPVLAMLAKRPEVRPSSAGEAVTALASRVPDGMLDDAVSSRQKPKSDATPPETPAVERAMARVENATVPAVRVRPPKDDAPVSAGGATQTSEVAATVSTEGLALQPSADRPSRTLPSPEAAVNARGLRPAEPGSAPEPPAARSPESRPPWVWPALAAAAIAIGAVAVIKNSGSPGPGPVASASAAPQKVTVHLSVSPPDADVMIDGLRMGMASEPLVLPRSDQRRALKLDKAGYEPYSLWIVADRDQDLPKVELAKQPLPAASSAPAASSQAVQSPPPPPSSIKAPVKKVIDSEIDAPEYSKHKK